MRFVFMSVIVLAVSGCADVLDSPAPAGAANKATVFGFLSRPKPTTTSGEGVLKNAAVFGGNVVITGPAGYCIDAGSLVNNAVGAFALLASCQNLTDGKAGDLVDAAVMTVTVLPRRMLAVQPNAADLEVDDIKVLDSINGDGFSLVHMAKGGNSLSPLLDTKYWRGGMLINGHIVGIALYAPKGSNLAERPGRFIAVSLAEALRTVSPAKTYGPVQASTVPATNTAGAMPAQKNPLKQLFPRIFQ